MSRHCGGRNHLARPGTFSAPLGVVKKALVERYQVDPGRLSTSADGDSVPIDTNDILEGRARN